MKNSKHKTMKKQLFKIFILGLMLTLFSNCATHTGYMGSSASLSSNNFSYIKRDVQGSASTIYVFGIGGLHKTALVNDAKNNLLKNYQLQDNQVLADITVNWKKTYFFFFTTNRCTVTASIVQFK